MAHNELIQMINLNVIFMLYLNITSRRAEKSARRIYRILAEKRGVKGRICFILCEARWLCQKLKKGSKKVKL